MLVETKLVGRRRSSPIEVDLRGRMTLRELVTALVEVEVTGYDARSGELLLPRVLGPDEIAAGADRGVVDSGGRRRAPAPSVEDAVRTATEAFDDGLWLVFVDGERIESLDASVVVEPSTTVRFVRLVALAGG